MKPKLFLATKALIENNGKILILRESAKNPSGTNPNSYDVVGGRLEPGESPEECLRREIKEEVGIEVKIGKPFYVTEWRPVVKGEQWQIVAVFYKCTTDATDITLNHEHDEYTWIDPKEYKNSDLIQNLIPVFEAYLEK